eukprot:Em0007g724a
MKTFRCMANQGDDDDSIVKHKLATTAVREDALLVLMEATPRHVNYEEVKRDLGKVAGVKHAHSLHIWSLTLTRTALAAHLALEPGVNYQDVLDAANAMLKTNHGIEQTTLQVEEYRIAMDTCHTCQNVVVKRPSLLENIVRRWGSLAPSLMLHLALDLKDSEARASLWA